MDEGDFAAWSRAVLAALWRADGRMHIDVLARELEIEEVLLERLVERMAELGLVGLEQPASRCPDVVSAAGGVAWPPTPRRRWG